MKKKLLFIIIFILTLVFQLDSVFAYRRATEEEYKEFLRGFLEQKYFINEDSDEESKTCDVTKVYAECTGVTVSATGKTYDLDTYVAGVLYAEPGYTIDGNDELGKAMAIAIRSYTLRHTNNCTNSIGSSSYEQNLIASDGKINTEKYKKYAEDTSGIVIEKDGKILEAMYYSLASGECDSISNGVCTVTLHYTYNSAEIHVVKVPVSALPSGILGAHNTGIALYAAKYQTEKLGWDYKKVLTEYYGSDIKLSKLSGITENSDISGDISCNDDTGDMVTVDDVSFPVKNYNNFTVNNSNLVSELKKNEYFANAGSNISQCPWYAKARALEIINTSNLSDELKEKGTAVLKQTSGNGVDWYGGVNSTLGNYFAYSSDINKPRAGAIIAWSGGKGHNYGHVGIIEKVNSDGTVVLSDGWNSGGWDASDTWSNVTVYTRTVSIDDLKTYDGYHLFEGYTYLFSYRK